MDLDTVAEELYGLEPGDFTARRHVRAAEARNRGDRVLAARIEELRRPTTCAWLANLLVRERAQHIDALLTLGAALRDASGLASPQEQVALARQRHQVVVALARQGRRLADAHGHPVSDHVERELEATLEAAMADPVAGQALRRGRLTMALSAGGEGLVPVEEESPLPVPRSGPDGLAANGPPTEEPDAPPSIGASALRPDSGPGTGTDPDTGAGAGAGAERAGPVPAPVPSPPPKRRPPAPRPSPQQILRRAASELRKREAALTEAEAHTRDAVNAYRQASEEVDRRRSALHEAEAEVAERKRLLADADRAARTVRQAQVSAQRAELRARTALSRVQAKIAALPEPERPTPAVAAAVTASAGADAQSS